MIMECFEQSKRDEELRFQEFYEFYSKYDDKFLITSLKILSRVKEVDGKLVGDNKILEKVLKDIYSKRGIRKK